MVQTPFLELQIPSSRALSHVLPLARLLCREDEEKKEEEEEEENIMDDFSV
jgi:hypothetical protein